jgi:hypothetical protein
LVWGNRLAAVGVTIEEHRYYFSKSNTGIMDIWHYLSVPSLATHALLKRWVLWPGKTAVLPIARWVDSWTDPGPSDKGSFLLIVGRKAASGS